METSQKGILNMTKEAEVDFNVFVGAETGILKGLNVHSKGNIALGMSVNAWLSAPSCKTEIY